MRGFGLYRFDRRVKVPDRSLVSALRIESGGFYSRIKLVQSEVPKNQQALPAARRIESSGFYSRIKLVQSEVPKNQQALPAALRIELGVDCVYNDVRGYGLFDKKTGDTVTKI